LHLLLQFPTCLALIHLALLHLALLHLALDQQPQSHPDQKQQPPIWGAFQRGIHADGTTAAAALIPHMARQPHLVLQVDLLPPSSQILLARTDLRQQWWRCTRQLQPWSNSAPVTMAMLVELLHLDQVPLIDWISDTLPQRCTDLQSPVKCLDRRYYSCCQKSAYSNGTASAEALE